MTAARYLARRSRTLVACVTLLALFSAGIATAMAAGGGTGSAKAKVGYWVAHSRNPQTRVNRVLAGEEPGLAECHHPAAVNGGLPECDPATTSDPGHSTESTSTDSHSTTTTITTTHTTTTTPTTTHSPTTSTPTTATTTTPTSVDVSIAKLANVTTALVGDQITYALTIHNSGPATATNVTVVDDLPPEVTFVSSSASQGSCTGTDPVRCTLGTLASGATATVTIVVRATIPGTAVNGASVSSTEPDTKTANNVAQAVVAIGAFTPPTCRSLSLVVSPRRAIVGQPITVVANVRDQNGNGVADVRVTIRGGGVTAAKSTDSRGRATFHFTPSRTGALQASIPAIASCASGAVSGVIRVRGSFRPPRPKVTG